MTLLGRLRHRLAPRGRARAVEDDPAIAVPFGFDPGEPPPARLALVVHLFWPEMAPLFAEIAARLGPADVLVTTDSEAKRAAILDAFADHRAGKVEVRIVPNRGRDIAPKLTAFADDYAAYDLLLMFHSKKTEAGTLGERWRAHIMDSLAGSEAVVRAIRLIFAADPGIGMVIPQHFAPVRPLLGWDSNWRHADRLARRMGLQLAKHGTLDFPSGSMFWARPAALAPLLALGLAAADFPPEAGQVRDTPAHAIERLFLLACETAGFDWTKVIGPGLGVPGEPVLTVASPADLASALAQTRFRVSATMLR